MISLLTPHYSIFSGMDSKLFSWTFPLRVVRYTTGHIWACPPSEGDDYIFHCHPPDQKIPKPKRLQEWYKKMLDKAVSERIVHDYKVRRTWGARTHPLLCSLPFGHLNRNLLFVLPFSKEEKLSFKRVRSTNLCFKDVMKNVFLIAIHD